MKQKEAKKHSVSARDSLIVTQDRKKVHLLFGHQAAFGTVTERFGRFTQHPHLDRQGLFTERPPGCDPCRYFPYGPRDTCKRSINTAAKDAWRFKQDLEEWATNLGYRNSAILKAKAWQQSLLGPAWYDPKELLTKDLNICSNIGFGRTRRFNVSKAVVTPPPGTYYHEIPFRAPYGPHSRRPTFQHSEPCRFKDGTKPWSIAPNRYYIRDQDSIAEKPKKIISLKGPYNLTTGPRIVVQRPRCVAATWPLALPGSFETHKKSRLGVMNKSGFNNPFRGRNALVDIALSVKKPSDPGPAEQNIEKPRVFKKYRYGFNSSNDKPVGYIRARVWPAVGRYSITSNKIEQRLIPGKGHTHVFTSKVQRTIGAVIPKPMNTF